MVMEQVTHKQRNVVATLPGKGPQKEKVYILCAHYDSANDPALEWDATDWDISQGHNIWKNVPAPGANDNASGVTAVIEAARILSQKRWNHTIKFVTFACEEYGLYGTGSDHYVQKAREEGELIAGVINLDMIGYQEDPDNLEIRVAGPQEYLSLMNALVRTGKAYDIDLQINRQLKPMRGDDAPFRAKGYLAIRVSEMPGYKYYHTEDDTIDRLNMQSDTETTRLAIATLAKLAGSVTANEESIE
jgi:Zn-dependent M28 family amino/carboxypeptidase